MSIEVTNAFVSESHPTLEVEFQVGMQSPRVVTFKYPFVEPKWIEIPFERNALPEDGLLQLRVNVKDPVSPAKLGKSEDLRLLGIGLSRVRLSAK
jgi:hypothetical protein